MDRAERVKEALASMIIPYICEHTGVSHDDVESVLESEMEFWMAHPNGVQLMFNYENEDGGEA
jgi:hypothetical protein